MKTINYTIFFSDVNSEAMQYPFSGSICIDCFCSF